MHEKFLRWQAVMYGRFNFQPTPKVTMALVNVFSPLGFMPMVVNQGNSDSGVQIQKISFNKNNVQIIFGNDRIDIVEVLPEGGRDFGGILENIEEYLSALSSHELEFNRIAFVKEVIFQDLTADEINRNQLKYMPWSKPNSREWSVRSINNEAIGGKKINVCFDLTRLKGIVLAGGKTENIDGIKTLHDISTDEEELKFIYDSKNIMQNFKILTEVIERESKDFTVN